MQQLPIVVLAFLAPALAGSIKNSMLEIPEYRHIDLISKLLDNGPNLRIINGREVVPHSIPYQIFLKASNRFKTWSCGGSLITRKYVLTAAHCLKGAQIVYVVLGCHNLRNISDDQLITRAKTFKMHHKYNTELIINDIGLVELQDNVTLSKTIGLVRLPSYSDVNANLEGLTSRISGWGLTKGDGRVSNVLLEVNNTIISNVKCKNIYKDVQNQQICLSGAEGKTVCLGDSGGPMIVGNIQVGIASYTRRGCLRGYPCVFVRISHFLDWIQTNSDWTPS